jgi:DNA-binding transcriptional LysR family regulator
MLQAQQQAAMAAGRTLKLRMQVRSFDAVGHMVAAGLGIAALPKKCGHTHRQRHEAEMAPPE